MIQSIQEVSKQTLSAPDGCPQPLSQYADSCIGGNGGSGGPLPSIPPTGLAGVHPSAGSGRLSEGLAVLHRYPPAVHNEQHREACPPKAGHVQRSPSGLSVKRRGPDHWNAKVTQPFFL